MRKTQLNGKLRRKSGFTLIEMSIVLVIIGLLVGGILAGQSLINAAAIRSQISQIEKYQAAVATFRGKYAYLPGDIPPNVVTQFGFSVASLRSGMAADGDGNGELDGSNCCTAAGWQQGGENLYFWEDLSSNSGLIAGGFQSVIETNTTPNHTPAPTCTSVAACSVYFPYAAIGNGAFIYVYSGYAGKCGPGAYTGCGPNFFGVSFINSMTGGGIGQGATPPAPALTVAQAYAIDTKMDDGLPTTGNVLAQYIGTANYQGWSHSSSSPSSTTCYDTSSGTPAYSIGYQNGSFVNCGISFKFTAGD